MIVALFLAAAPINQDTPDAAWKIEAMRAAERLQEIDTALKATAKGTPTQPQLGCEKILKTAYVLHLTSADVVRKQNGAALFFHLALRAGADEVFDFSYVYERKDNALVGARITSLPKRWVIAFAEANKILVRSDGGCTFELDTKDPFAARSFVTKDNAPK